MSCLEQLSWPDKSTKHNLLTLLTLPSPLSIPSDWYSSAEIQSYSFMLRLAYISPICLYAQNVSLYLHVVHSRMGKCMAVFLHDTFSLCLDLSTEAWWCRFGDHFRHNFRDHFGDHLRSDRWSPKWHFGDHFTDQFGDDLRSDLRSDVWSDLWICTTKLP